ncbi:hypothetical protein ACIBH1_20725 [Nonomuraea sp. NPDC050663]
MRDLDCTPDFKTQPQAQREYDKQWKIHGADVHDLDRDGNGLACESLPPG